MRRPSDLPLVAAELRARIDDLVRWLGLAPLDKRGGMFTPLNPVRADRKPGSFVIYGSGHAKQGGWQDFATGDKGDALHLIAYVKTGNRDALSEARQIARRFLGWDGAEALSRPDDAARRRRLEEDRAQAEQRAADERARNRDRAFARWLDARPLTPGDPAWRYLSDARGIDLARLAAEGRLPGACRFEPEALHTESGRRWPALISLIVGPEGEAQSAPPLATHRVFLTPEGQKAPVTPVRKIWPRGFWGGAIRIAKGRSKLSPAKALAAGVRDDVLAITEGVEDALTVALLCPEWRVWAAGAAGAMGAVEVPACVGSLVLVRDKDEEARLARLARAEGGGTLDDIEHAKRALAEVRRAWARTLSAAAKQAHAKGFALYQVAPKGSAKDFNEALQALRGRA